MEVFPHFIQGALLELRGGKLTKIFISVVFCCIIFFVYRNWFSSQEILGGDWPYFFKERLVTTTLIPPAWNTVLLNGLGGVSPLYPLQIFHQFTISVSNFFNIPCLIIYKFFWFGMFLVFSCFSMVLPFLHWGILGNFVKSV